MVKRRLPDPRTVDDAEFWALQHTALGGEPIVWVLRADALFDAFELLVREDENRPVIIGGRRIRTNPEAPQAEP